MTRLRRLAASLAFAGAYALVVRPRLLRWGATDEEVRRSFPGADVVPGGRRGATMAVTIDAPPARVWPWLAQMGCDRGGWYRWNRLDNGGVPSAERIRPEWQQISLGDHLASTPDGRAWFKVAALEPRRFLGLRAPLDLRGRPFDTRVARPRSYSDSIWSFLLEELPGDRTRLVVSGYAAYHPRLLLTIGNIVFWEPAHVFMQTRQFANLKRRAERKESQMSPKQQIARVGDWIEVHGHEQGQPPRHAMVLEVLGTSGKEHYRVRWADDEHESIFFPGPDAMVKRKKEPARGGKPGARQSAQA